MKRGIKPTMNLLFIAAFAVNTFSQTIIPEGDVFGFWTKANSPYLVTGNITIPIDSCLVIEPGCYIEFKFNKSLTINGSIHAAGTEYDSIVFTVEGGTPSGFWKGILFENGFYQDTSCLKYCRLEKAKSYPDFHGGLLNITNSANIQIENCELKHGVSSSSGGGMIMDFTSNILIKNNHIHHCSATQRGGAILIGAVENCFIVSNKIANNTAEWGGAIYINDGAPKIINNIFSHNQARLGGAIGMIDAYWISNGYYYFTNNTLAHNYASEAGPGMWMLDATFGIYNCIFYHNYGPPEQHQIYLAEWGNPSFYNCAIEGGLAGISTIDSVSFTGIFENCIDADPWTLGNIYNQYQLTAGSPCINAGITLPELEIPAYDFAGNARIVMDTIDIGAYEFQIITHHYTENQNDLFKVFPNPSKGLVQLILPEMPDKPVIIELYSATGKKIDVFVVTAEKPELDLTDRNRGIYFLKVKQKHEVFIQKIILF